MYPKQSEESSRTKTELRLAKGGAESNPGRFGTADGFTRSPDLHGIDGGSPILPGAADEEADVGAR